MNLNGNHSASGWNWPSHDEKTEQNKKDIKTLWGAFKPLPNVRDFKVEVSDWDELSDKHGIKKRLDKATLISTPNRNKFLNRYMEHQLIRMKKANPLTYWRMAEHLMKKSNIFFVMALNHVQPLWHRKMKLSSVIRLAKRARRIANSSRPQLNFVRKFIPKSNGKLRPLGIPTLPWRIYLHMFNQLLSNYLEWNQLMHDSQHGFRPGRGTGTAWNFILSEVVKSRDIYEFDLKGYFDSINLDVIREKLLSKGIPENVANRLHYINLSGVKTKPQYHMNEIEAKIKSMMMKGASIEDLVNLPKPISYLYRAKGVPQGSPTSPLLSLLALEGSILDRPGLKSVMYADDGLYYGDIDCPVITPNSGMVSSNISFNLSKTGWVKKEGVWLKPLKFLGLTFNGETFQASTRKGSSLIYDKDQYILENHYRDNDSNSFKEFRDLDSWERLIKSKLWGLIQSRLYIGEWDPSMVDQCFRLTYSKGSYTYKNVKRESLTIYNSSSYACYWLVHKLKRSTTLVKSTP